MNKMRASYPYWQFHIYETEYEKIQNHLIQSLRSEDELQQNGKEEKIELFAFEANPHSVSESAALYA